MGYVIEGQNGQKIYLIDTPGFDDTHADDAKVFREVASVLCTICGGQPLTIGGIIYVHRITDMRMAGTALKSLRIFEKICGEECFRDVTVVTTMWSMLRNKEAWEAALLREDILRKRPEFFGSLVAGGARFTKYEESRESALKIVEVLASRQHKVVLNLQREMMISDRMTLSETTAGRFLEGELANTRRRYEKEKKELEEYETEANDDEETMQSIVEQKNDYASRIEQSALSQGSLSITRDDMRHERREWVVRVHTDGLYSSNVEEKSTHVQELEEELYRLRQDYKDQRRENQEKSEKMHEQNKKVEALEKERDEQIRREKVAKERIRKLPQKPFVELLRGALGIAASKEAPQQARRADSIPQDVKPSKRHAPKAKQKSKSKGQQKSKAGKKSSHSHNRHHEATIDEVQATQDAETSETDEDSEDEVASRTQSPTLGFSMNMSVGPKHVVYDDSGLLRRVPTPPQYPAFSQLPHAITTHNEAYGYYDPRTYAYYNDNTEPR
jgi:myosin heavy subunit